jgi:transaldolase
VFHVNQALLAAKAGATFVSPFMGRLDDIGDSGIRLIQEIVEVYSNYAFETQILAASIRNSEHVKQVALAGADVATMPPEVFATLFQHHLTDKGLAKFMEDWKSAQS